MAAPKTRARRKAPAQQELVYRALADDTRRQILALLARGSRPAGEIASEFSRISRPAVSKHLALLREAGLVADRAAGRGRVYALELAPLAAVTAFVAQLEAGAAPDALRRQPGAVGGG
ncbi:MAG TPA: metalloregulator ArsR/SmtB family transcription factor [Candidatus Thermoplasmatota archaeon]|nr:metalloregulator ArsR/SmtB family transcription factor [Candidatus Thermoplasmatota archaeon]